MSAQQLDLLDALAVVQEADRLAALPPIIHDPAAPRISNHAPDDPHDRRRYVKTSAYNHDGWILVCHDDDALPIEIEHRGMPMVISFGYGFSVHAVEKWGSEFISNTGYRSFAGLHLGGFGPDAVDEIRAVLDAFIDGPRKNGNGLGGKLERWWPHEVQQWQQAISWGLRCDRSEVWTQWGPERHREAWADHDAKIQANLDWMRAHGIDPDDVGPPEFHQGKWPTFSQGALL